MTNPDSFGSRATLEVGGRQYTYYRLDSLDSLSGGNAARLPISLKILLENLLRNEDGKFVKELTSRGSPSGTSEGKSRRRSRFEPLAFSFRISRAFPRSSISPRCAMRSPSSAVIRTKINPLQPVDLVIDHSVQVDEYGTEAAFLINTEQEFDRNKERYAFLRWGQKAFRNFRVVPPGTGIVPSDQPRVSREDRLHAGRRTARRSLIRTLSSVQTHTRR